MKKIITLLMLAIIGWNNLAHSQCNEIFISEYVEGTNNNKAIELYNPSSNAIALNNNYRMVRYNNGTTAAAGEANPQAMINLGTHVMQPYSTWVIVLDRRDTTQTSGTNMVVAAGLRAVADTFLCYDYNVSYTMNFNGNDALSLQKTSNGGATWNYIDIFGMMGDAAMVSGFSWSDQAPYDGSAGAWWTLNHTLIRKPSVSSGVTVNPSPEFIVTTEWDSLSVDTWSNLHTHICNCPHLIYYSTTNINCYGNNTGSILVTNVPYGTGPYQYSINGGVTYQSSALFNGLAAGTYQLISKDVNNVLSAILNVVITSPPALTINAYSGNTICGTTTGSASAYVSGGISPFTYLWSNGDTTNSIQNLTIGTYSLTVTDNNGCVTTSPTLNIGVDSIVTPKQICMVSVDSLSNHNIVIWEKTGLEIAIDSFKIYREVTTNVYSNIGSVAYDSLSEFHDFGANPNVTSYKYKIAVLDSCGALSPMSAYHNTIHLQYLGNGNLLWSLYSIENTPNPVNFYVISRDDSGSGNFLPISSTIPGGNNSFTDINYASYPNARYRVDVSWNISCNPTRTATTTHSNIIHAGSTVSSVLSEIENACSISPNPATDEFRINNSLLRIVKVNIFNVIGEVVLTQDGMTSNEVLINASELKNGMYFAEVITEKGTIRKKIMKK